MVRLLSSIQQMESLLVYHLQSAALLLAQYLEQWLLLKLEKNQLRLLLSNNSLS